MMGKHGTEGRGQYQIISLEDLVPADHLVRKIEAAIDFSFIYDLTKDLYSEFGRESIDPVVLIKIPLLQYTFGISSMRRAIAEIEVNNAYRWFLGYGFCEKIPHFSTFGKNYVRRFKDTDLFEQIFSRILDEAYRNGFVKDEQVFIDGTHIKASANNHKYENREVRKAARKYQKELEEEIEADRAAHGKKPLKSKEEEPELVNQKVSTTDPERGVFHKGEHRKVFAYSANTCCDANGFVLDYELTAGNINDNVSFFDLYERIKKNPRTKYYVMDAGYKIPAIARMVLQDGHTPVLPYKRPMTKKEFFHKKEYVYDEHYDCYLCPNNQILKYSTTNRNGYREYKSDPCVCESCPFLNQCTNSSNHVKVGSRPVWESFMERVEHIRHTEGMKDIYNRRKETIERVFAEGKENHGLRYTHYRGLARVKMSLTLTFSCLNLKKLARWKWKHFRFLFYFDLHSPYTQKWSSASMANDHFVYTLEYLCCFLKS